MIGICLIDLPDIKVPQSVINVPLNSILLDVAGSNYKNCLNTASLHV